MTINNFGANWSIAVNDHMGGYCLEKGFLVIMFLLKRPRKIFVGYKKFDPRQS